MKDIILAEYKKNEKTYNDYRQRVTHLITDLLSEQEIQVHQINSRNKTFESLSKKIEDKNDKYESIQDITDIVGIRIITYLEGEVDLIADLIEREFIVDRENSIDKRRLKSDQFGYRSLHIVASFNTDRCNLKEYKRYKGIKCEIQIRSILQHAWAEIEHDLGYKGEISIPEEYKRTFNRLSALLETADIEFDRLKTQLTNYEEDVPKLIKSEPELVDINKASLNSFIQTNQVLVNAKIIIEKWTEMPLLEREIDDLMIKRIKYFNLKSIKDIEEVLQKNESRYLKFVQAFLEERIEKHRPIISVATLMYFIHYLALSKEYEDKLYGYFNDPEIKYAKNMELEDYIRIYQKYLKE
jgi:putative GTP pyrophosphokinase